VRVAATKSDSIVVEEDEEARETEPVSTSTVGEKMMIYSSLAKESFASLVG
jgi:hypothetical protein